MTLPLNSRLSALYETDGVQKDFGFGFRVFYDPDNGGYGIEARIQTADGYDVIPKSEYIVMPIEDNTAGIVRFHIAPPAGQEIYLAGNTPTIQQLVLTNFGRFSAESIEDQFDFITAIIQEWISSLSEEERQRIAGDEILRSELIAQWTADNNEFKDYIESLVNALIGADILPLTDKSIKTWSGGTQEEKNKENISAQDYGAKGEGVTDDTQAFLDLEATYQGRNIDLLGKTYLVDKVPAKNQYVNGIFKVGTQLTKANTDINANESDKFNSFQIRDKKASLRYDLLRSAGNGAGNVIQSIATDVINRYIYTLTVHEFGSFVDRFNLDGGVTQNSLGRTEFLYKFLGHQGLAVEYMDSGNNRLWSSCDYSISNSIAHAVSFEFMFKADGYPTEYELWDGFNKSLVTGSASSTPTISANNKFFIMKANIGSNCVVRGWDMDFIKSKRATPDRSTPETVTNTNSQTFTRTRKEYDIYNDYAFEFVIDWTKITGGVDIAFQDMVCDGNFIYILAGYSSSNDPTFIAKVNLLGEIISVTSVDNFGLADSIAIDPNYAVNGYAFREPEGMSIVPNNTGGYRLLVNVATAVVSGARKCYVYDIGGAIPLDQVSNGGILVGGNPVDIIGTTGRIKLKNSGSADGMTLRNEALLLGSSEDTKAITGVGNARLQISSDATGHGITLNRFSNSTGGSYLSFYKSRGNTTWGSDMAAVQNGDYLGFLTWLGNNGDDAGLNSGIGVEAAQISARCTGAIANGRIPTELRFATSDTANGNTLRYTIASTGDLLPAASNQYNIGGASNLVKTVYAGTGTINTSDERLKQQFRSQSENERLAALEIKNSICLFKFNDAVDLKGDGARWHVGVKAQQVISILESHDLDPFEYAFVCFDEWDEQEEIIESWDDEYDDDGSLVREAGSQVTQEYRAAGNQYAIRYDELTMFILAAM